MSLTPEIETLFLSDDLDEIGYLLQNGLDVNSLLYDYNAIMWPECGLEKTKFLIKHGINFKFTSKEGLNALFSYAHMSQPFDKFKFLVENGVNYNQICNYAVTDSVFNNCSIEIAEYLFKHLNFDIYRINEGGFNLLNSSKREVCEFLFKQNVDIFHLSKNDYNTLFCNSKDTMEYLVNLGVDPFHISSKNGNSNLFNADLETVKYLCDLGLAVNHQNNNGETCLMHADFETIKYLVEEKGADIHHLDKEQKNILHHKNDDIDIVQYALDKKVSISEKQEMQDLNERYMLSKSPTDLVPSLIEFGVLEQENFKDVIFNNTMNHESTYLYISSYLNKGGNINITDKNKNLFMVHAQNEKVVNLLLNKDINIFYYYYNDYFFAHENILNYCWHLSTYNLLIQKGFFTNPRYQLIKNYFSFDTFSKLKSNELYQKFLYNNDIDFSRDNKGNSIFFEYFSHHRIKHFIKQGADVNGTMEYLQQRLYPLSIEHNIKNYMSLIRNGADVNFYINEECIIHILEKLRANYNQSQEYKFKNVELQFMKFLVKYGFNISSIQQKYGIHYLKFQSKFIAFIYDSPDKYKLLEMFKQDIYSFQFEPLVYKVELFQDFFAFNNEFIKNFSLKNKQAVMLFLFRHFNKNKEKYTQQIIYMLDTYPECISEEIIGKLMLSDGIWEPVIQDKTKPLILKFLNSENIIRQEPFLFKENFYLPEALLSEIPDEVLMQLNNKDENILFYNKNEYMISCLLNKKIDINQLSMNRQNCFTFRLKNLINSRRTDIKNEMSILSLFLKNGVDYNLIDNEGKSIFKLLSQLNENDQIKNFINIEIDKIKLNQQIDIHSETKKMALRI